MDDSTSRRGLLSLLGKPIEDAARAGVEEFNRKPSGTSTSRRSMLKALLASAAAGISFASHEAFAGVLFRDGPLGHNLFEKPFSSSAESKLPPPLPDTPLYGLLEFPSFSSDESVFFLAHNYLLPKNSTEAEAPVYFRATFDNEGHIKTVAVISTPFAHPRDFPYFVTYEFDERGNPIFIKGSAKVQGKDFQLIESTEGVDKTSNQARGFYQAIQEQRYGVEPALDRIDYCRPYFEKGLAYARLAVQVEGGGLFINMRIKDGTLDATASYEGSGFPPLEVRGFLVGKMKKNPSDEELKAFCDNVSRASSWDQYFDRETSKQKVLEQAPDQREAFKAGLLGEKAGNQLALAKGIYNFLEIMTCTALRGAPRSEKHAMNLAAEKGWHLLKEAYGITPQIKGKMTPEKPFTAPATSNNRRFGEPDPNR